MFKLCIAVGGNGPAAHDKDRIIRSKIIYTMYTLFDVNYLQEKGRFSEILSNHTNLFPSILPGMSHIKEAKTQVCFVQEIPG